MSDSEVSAYFQSGRLMVIMSKTEWGESYEATQLDTKEAASYPNFRVASQQIQSKLGESHAITEDSDLYRFNVRVATVSHCT